MGITISTRWYSTRPKRGPIEALRGSWTLFRVHRIPRVLSVAPLKLTGSKISYPVAECIPRVLSVAPLKLEPAEQVRHFHNRIPRVLSVAPLKRMMASCFSMIPCWYSTRPKRGPIEAPRQCKSGIRRQPDCIPRVLSVAPLKLGWSPIRLLAESIVFHAS